ncbi:MAG TPA: cytochrome c biogenesis protein CcsA [Bryobacteraceae bacterium]|nr:cytochrome c biogenesis protein CcsA [Bryobacteraceae bacterium]HPT27221.1 cytochrome c biogenesis protein CcsA [Bryobacteraceae bacterium]
MGVFWVRIATILYAAGLADALVTLFRRDARLFGPAMAAFRVAVVLHGVAIVEQSVAVGGLAANNFFETASLCGFVFSAVFLVVHWKYQFQGLSLAVFPVVFFLTLTASLGTPGAGWASAETRGALLLAHISLVLAGYAGLLLSAAGAVSYLVQERRLKRKGFNVTASAIGGGKLPPLATLDRLVTISMSAGFVAITLAVVLGSIWAYIETGTRWIGEAKIIIGFVTWGFYLLMLILRMSAGWRGRRAALLSLVVVLFAALTWAAHVGLRPLLER